MVPIDDHLLSLDNRSYSLRCRRVQGSVVLMLPPFSRKSSFTLINGLFKIDSVQFINLNGPGIDSGQQPFLLIPAFEKNTFPGVSADH